VCSSGTYVRSLARDIGRAAGSAAHLAALRRLAVGALDLAGAIGIEELRRLDTDAALALLKPATDELLALDPRYLTERADKLTRPEGTA